MPESTSPNFTPPKLATNSQPSGGRASDPVRELKQENREAIGQMRSLLEKADEEKNSRDRENTIVRKVVKEIEPLRKTLEIERKALQAMEKEVGPMRKDMIALPSLKKQIDSLEYMLHLQGSSPTQEKRISKQINELAAKVKALTASQPKLTELEAARQKFHEANAALGAKVKELKEHADLSEGHHRQMIAALGEVHKMEDKLSGSLKELDEKRAEFKQAKKARREKEKHKQERQRQHAELHFASRNGKEQQSGDFQQRGQRGNSPILFQPSQPIDVKKKADEIMAKFKAGEPITAEEMQLLSFAGTEL